MSIEIKYQICLFYFTIFGPVPVTCRSGAGRTGCGARAVYENGSEGFAHTYVEK